MLGIHYRLGEVPALATPNPIDGDGSRRHSARVSFHGEADWASHSEMLTSPEHTTHTSSELLSPGPAARMSLSPTDLLRQSYVTTTSSTSRISQLSDFPVPPGQQQVVTPASLIQSYFDDLPRNQRQNTHSSDQFGTSPSSSEMRRQRLLSHRTTFGTETSVTEDLTEDLTEGVTEA